MTITGITQTYASFSALRLSVTSSATAAPPTTSTATATPVDTAAISPQAAAAGTEPAAANDAAATAAPPPAPPSAADRATALFAALDADHDGTVTGEEFTSGAKQILSQARGPRRAGDGDHDRGRHDGHGVGRLEKKLERLFERVDANGDGAIDQEELTGALAAADARRQPAAPSTTPAAGATTVTFSFTVVSIAVKRYTSLQDAAIANGTPAGATGGADGATDTPASGTPIAA